MSGPCEVCSINPSKYRCPACDKQTCSARCVSSHKKSSGCSGSRPASEFVPIKQFNDKVMHRDFSFLERTQGALQACKRLQRGDNAQRRGQLRKEALSRGICLRLLPHVFGRAENNTSQVRKGKGGAVIWWRVEWRFTTEAKIESVIAEPIPIPSYEEATGEGDDEDHTVRVFRPPPYFSTASNDMIVLTDRAVPEDRMVGDLLTRFFENTWKSEPTKHRLLPFLQGTCSIELETGSVIDPTLTLRDALVGKVVVEHPVFIVRSCISQTVQIEPAF